MKSYNYVSLVGNLTRDPELNTTSNGTPVCKFSIAVNEVWYDKNDEKQERVNYFDCTCWDKRGEAFSKYHHKGDPVFVTGKLRQDKWEDKNGDTRYSVSIVVDDFIIVKPWEGDDSPRQSSSGRSKRDNSVSAPRKKGDF